LAQCSVFRGGFTLVDAEAILDLSALGEDLWPDEVLGALVDGLVDRPSEVASLKISARGGMCFFQAQATPMARTPVVAMPKV
jgi:hypothetical protein